MSGRVPVGTTVLVGTDRPATWPLRTVDAKRRSRGSLATADLGISTERLWALTPAPVAILVNSSQGSVRLRQLTR
jgi:hypothetical protein